MLPEKKIPKFLSKPLTEQEFQKRILGRIYISEDRDFLNGLYTRDESGKYLLKPNLSPDEIKRLRGLAKSIKANRGVVKKGRLILLAVLLGGILIFNLVFKNWLAELAAERGLESVFVAQADISRMRVALLKGRISFDHLQVADRKRPMRNLFELGKTEVSFNTIELLKGKIVAENIECNVIRWNTPRETPGRLPWDRESGADREGIMAEVTPSLGLGLPSIDVEELIEQHVAKLQSRDTAEKLNRQLEEVIGYWSTALRETESQLKGLTEDVEAIGRINVAKIGSASEAQTAIARIGRVYPAVESLEKDISGISSKITDDRGQIDEAYRQVQDALDQDYEYLLSFIGSPENTVKALVSSVAKEYLKSFLGNYYGYALRAVDLANNLKAKGDKPARPRRRAGVNVPYPTRRFPKFLLENLAASVGSRSSSEYTEGFLKNVSSDPDLTDEPVTFRLDQRQGKQSLSVQGAIDARTKRRTNFQVDFKASGYPFSIKEGLEFLKLRSVEGKYTLESDFTLDRQNAATGLVSLTLSDLDTVLSVTDDPVGTALVEILGTASRVVIRVRFQISKDGSMKLSASSDVDRLISGRIGEYIARLTADYQEELRKELTRRISDTLKGNDALYASFKDLEKASDGNITDIRSHKKLLDEKNKDLENRANRIQREAEKKVTDEVEEALDKVKDKIKLPF